MNENPAYPQLNQLFGVYLNEDCAYWGGSIKEIVGCYIRDSSKASAKAMLDEIERFKGENSGNLDSAFEEAYGSQFAPELWGHTTTSFLDELKRLLSE